MPWPLKFWGRKLDVGHVFGIAIMNQFRTAAGQIDQTRLHCAPRRPVSLPARRASPTA